MMDPTREPWSTPATPGGALPDDAIVAYLRANAPGLPVARFDARTVTVRVRRALRRRRLRRSVVAAAATVAVYVALALAGPLSVPGLGTVTVPGSDAFRVGGFLPMQPPGRDQWHLDVDRLEADVVPVVEEIELSYYLLDPGSLFGSGPCRVLEYPRGNYRDGDPACRDLVPFDAVARADFDEVTEAVARSGVPVERIYRVGDGIHVRLKDSSWRYNWEYVYLRGVDAPPATQWPGEEWTHIHGDWWFFRAHDD